MTALRLAAVGLWMVMAAGAASTPTLAQAPQAGAFATAPPQLDPAAVQATLAALPGVSRVHDLHIWATGTAHTTLTAHLVMPDGGADDAFLQAATEQLRQRFDITHVTLQTVRVPFTEPCQPS